MAEEWRALGNVIDRVTFIISLIILFSLFIWMMLKRSQSQSHGEEDSSDDDH